MNRSRDDESHCIRILLEAGYAHATGKYSAEVLSRGDGGIEQWLGIFRAALVIAGYSPDQAQRLKLTETAASPPLGALRDALKSKQQ